MQRDFRHKQRKVTGSLQPLAAVDLTPTASMSQLYLNMLLVWNQSNFLSSPLIVPILQILSQKVRHSFVLCFVQETGDVNCVQKFANKRQPSQPCISPN